MSGPSWRLLSEPLEARILHSADFSPLTWAGGSELQAESAQIEAIHSTADQNEIVFVDAALPDGEDLIADLRAQQGAGRTIEIVRVGAGSDGLALISETLANARDITAVHVLAHGSDGQMRLGSAVLDAQTLSQRSDEIAAWGNSMTGNADLLLYGCDLAEGAEGQRLVRDLAALTGADVAASTDLTGAAARGGNWTLEYGIGRIEAALAPSQWAQAQWQGVLATYTVTTTADGAGAGTLRWAISQANTNAGTDTIVFGVNGTFNIAASSSGDDNNSAGDFDVRDSVNIVGNGNGSTIISGNGSDRVLDLRSGTISLSGLTIQGGASNQGAGIRVEGGANATLTDVVVQNNTGAGGTKGAGIYNDGSLTLRRVIVQNNGATGSSDIEGAGLFIDKDAVLDARDVEIRGNVAIGDKDGGGLYIDDNATVLLQNVTLAGNTAGRGGGLFAHSDNVSLVNVTVAGNTGRFEGGGLWSDGRVTLDHVSIVANTSAGGKGGGVYGDSASVSTRNSLFASNTGGNTSAALSSQGYNLSDDNSSGFLSAGDRRNIAAGVLTLAANGGFTRTAAINAGSAARDTANPVSTLTADQRGIATFNSRADIGAYEYNPQGFAPTISAISNQSIAEDQTLPAVGFTISDFETSPASLLLSATSSNTALVANASIVFGGSGANRTVSLAPAANANSPANGGPTTITITVSDGTNSASAGFVVTVNPLNDAPSITLPTAQSVNEDGVLVLGGGNTPQVTDVDAGSAPVQVTLAVANGTISLSQTTGLAFVTGTGSNNAVMTFNGSQAAVNSALAGLQYRPGADFSGSDRLDLSVNDLGNSGGAARSTNGSLDITVIARNDAPLLGLPGPQATPQPTPLSFSAASGNAITVSDIDAGGAALQVTLDVVNGSVTFGSLSGLTLVEGTGTADGRVVLAGTLSNLNTALGTMSFSGLVVGPARIDLTLDDLGNSGAGAVGVASGSVAITVGNDALPLLTLGSATATFTEGGSAILLDPGLTLSDADNPTLASAQVSIGVGYAAEDVLAFVNDGATMGNITGSYGAGALTLTSLGQSATLAEWEAALRAVTYANAAESPSTATRTLTLTVNDGIADSAARQIALGVVAINDAPVLGGANNLAAIVEDAMASEGTLVATLIAGHIADADSPALAGIAVVTVDDSQGIWQYTVDGGANWLAFGSVNDGAARLLAADSTTLVRFVPAADWNGTVAGGIRFRAWDQTDPGVGGVADTTTNGGSTAFSSATFSAAIAVTPVNDAPSGTVTVAGTATQGQTLTAGHTLADADGPATLSISYQWYADGLAISGATGSVLLLGQSQVGQAISVVASYTDALGMNESVLSAATAAVANVNDAPSGTVTVTGTAAQGQTLTAAHALADADGPATLAISYQWYADGVAIGGATGSALLVGQSQVGQVISVVASYTDAFGMNESVASTASAPVANVNDAPSGTVTVTGAATQGQTLTAGHTLADADGPATLAISYQWYADGVAIGGATGSTLLLNQGHVGQAINVVASYTDGLGMNERVVSAATPAVANANRAPVLAGPVGDQPTTSGRTLQFALPPATFTDPDAGDTLSFSVSLADGSPLPDWIRFDAASQVFTVTHALGGTLGPAPVRVIASDPSGASAQVLFAFVVVASPAEPSAPPAVIPPATPVPPPASAQTATLQPNVLQPAKPPAAEAAPGEPTTAPTAEAEAVSSRSAPPTVATRVVEPGAAQEPATGLFDQRPNKLSTAESAPVRSASRSDSVLASAVVSPYTDLAASPLSQLLGSDDVLRQLDELQRQLSEVGEEHRGLVASSVAVTTGLSIGYVVWLVRGGVLVSSMLSALPAWQMIDPLPVLAAVGALKRRREAEASDEPEVERLFSEPTHGTEHPAARAPQSNAPHTPLEAAFQETQPTGLQP